MKWFRISEEQWYSLLKKSIPRNDIRHGKEYMVVEKHLRPQITRYTMRRTMVGLSSDQWITMTNSNGRILGLMDYGDEWFLMQMI